MNTSKLNRIRIALAVLSLVLAVVVATPKVYAQDDDGSGGCACDTGYADTSYSDSYAPDTGYGDTSYQDSYAPETGYGDTSYQDSYTPDTGYGDTSYQDSYSPDTGYGDTSYQDSYTPDTGYGDTSYQDSYSPTPTYSSAAGFSVTNPSYGSNIYTTPGIGYSSNIYTTPAIGFSTPIYAPTPVNHNSTPTPIVYNTPTSPVQTSQAPIIINNTNTNTNTNPNTNTIINTAPVAPAQPQTIVDYVYPQTNPIYQPVSCTITATPSVIQNGAPTILSWTSYGATSAVLSDGIGQVSTNGTITARPNGSIDYVLTVYGQGTTGTCNVTVNVGGYSQVSLSQIPYTGFDFGPVGDAIYWAALMAFALAAAYLLVYYRGGAFTLATAMVTGRSSIKPMNFTEAPAEVEVVEAPVAPVAVNARLASVIAPIQNLPTAEIRRMTSDAMIVNHSKNGSAPRIVITRG